MSERKRRTKGAGNADYAAARHRAVYISAPLHTWTAYGILSMMGGVDMWKIRINQVRCDGCGEVIVSTTRHDLRWCKCRSVAVDGGTDYLRRITGSASASFTELSEYENEPDREGSIQNGAS